MLIGMMGSGKTTVGKAYAERIGRPFVDTDQMIEAKTGRTVRDLFADDGEAAFRVLESGVLIDALARTEPHVIAAAGGAVLSEVNRLAMRESANVVWLRAMPATLASRVGPRAGRGHRPLIDDNPLQRITQMVHDRADVYADAANVVIDVDLLNKSNVLDLLDVVLA